MGKVAWLAGVVIKMHFLILNCSIIFRPERGRARERSAKLRNLYALARVIM